MYKLIIITSLLYKLTDITYSGSWSGWRSNGWCSLWIERRLHLSDVIQFNAISRFDMTV